MTKLRAKCLMIQGTTSSAGKSTVVSGLCRLLHRSGYRVAPFKPQNMALNSAVSVDGGEIGRSQAVQAMAAGVPAHSDMNPVLLKPHSDVGAQVIIQGRAVGHFEAGGYQDYKAEVMPFVLESFERLRQQFDFIVIEGAGSPAEINLRKNDIANMGFATAVDCPVVLVGDIDRGGVFAHLTGTLDCLVPDERDLITGFLINRFRGERALLTSAIDWLTEQTGKPTHGVLPWIPAIDLPSEDSVAEASVVDVGSPVLRINVPRFPRMSNHTDFDPLRQHPGIDIAFVGAAGDMPPCDLVILPGSKNTMADLGWLTETGWREYIQRHLRYGGKVLGICGGLQMLGQWIHDPEGVEGQPGSVRGLELMTFSTRLMTEKRLERVSGRLLLDDTDVEGYEVHMGETTGLDQYSPLLQLDNGKRDGAISEDGQLACTYLHGLFDKHTACASILRWAGLEKTTGEKCDYSERVQQSLDRVADVMESEISAARWLTLFG